MELVQLLDGREGCGRGSRLLLQPADNFVGGAATVVLARRAVNKELERRVALDFELLAQAALDGGVDFAKGYWQLGLGNDAGGFGVLWGKRFAVATPWGV